MILDLFRKEIAFENIQGYDDIKELIGRILDSEQLTAMWPSSQFQNYVSFSYSRTRG